MTEPLVRIAGLRLGFETGAGRVEVLRGIDLEIASGEVLALVGESGSGKSALGRSILNLHAPPFVPDRAHMAGSIRLRGEEVLGAGSERLRRLRATGAALISQEALSGLNPVVRVGAQVAEAARAADPARTPDAARRAAHAMLEAVGLGGGPGQRPVWRAYPHELSGGQ
ncbi:MAG: ATP-binding cassette domain-containing protein, partial [Sphingomonadales bacterium]|nr:ATP-binding cassette domain-containing protein [Sphingomonadales bacterium]